MLAICAILFCSCSRNYEKLRVVETKVTNIKFLGSSNVEVDFNVKVDNPTSSSYTVSSLSGKFFRKGDEFADIMLLEKAKIAPRTMNELRVPLQITMTDPLGFLNGINLDTFKSDAYTVNLDMRIRGGCGLSKHLVYENLPAKALLEEFGIAGAGSGN